MSLSDDFLQNFVIVPPALSSAYSKKVGSNNLCLTIQALITNPSDPSQKFLKTRHRSYPSTTPVKKVISDFRREVPEISGKNVFLYYNNIYYEDGTLESCGIQSNSLIEIVALKKYRKAMENEGFKLIFWAIVPLIIAVSMIGAGLIGRFGQFYRACYVLVGGMIGVPATIVTILGILERFNDVMKVEIAGQYWFGPNCCNYSCDCNKTFCCFKEEEPVTDINQLVQNMNNAIESIMREP